MPSIMARVLQWYTLLLFTFKGTYPTTPIFSRFAPNFGNYLVCKNYALNKLLTCSLQNPLSSTLPLHPESPISPNTHARVLDRIPPPHGSVHSVQLPHSVKRGHCCKKKNETSKKQSRRKPIEARGHIAKRGPR